MGFKICLSMIVKDESKIIEACLDNVRNLVDAMVIDDTGSTDGTPDIINSYLAKHKITGSVRVTPWKDFGFNRTQAIRHAEAFLGLSYADPIKGVTPAPKTSRTDTWYLLFMDADNAVKADKVTSDSKKNVADEFVLNKGLLGSDIITVDMMDEGGYTRYDYRWMIKLGVHQWKWWYPVHEYIGTIDHDAKTTALHMRGVLVISGRHGARSRDSTKYLKDAVAFESYLCDNPNDPRALFYLARSYNDSGKKQLAYENYLKRSEVEGWYEEKYIALLSASGLAKELYPKEEHKMLEPLFKAIELKPDRMEAAYNYMVYLSDKECYRQAWIVGKEYLHLEKPAKGALFLNEHIRQWRLFKLCAVCCMKLNDKEHAKNLFRRALKAPNIPEHEKADIDNMLGK